jgi:hypothetical protein
VVSSPPSERSRFASCSSASHHATKPGTIAHATPFPQIAIGPWAESAADCAHIYRSICLCCLTDSLAVAHGAGTTAPRKGNSLLVRPCCLQIPGKRKRAKSAHGCSHEKTLPSRKRRGPFHPNMIPHYSSRFASTRTPCTP